MRVVANLAEAMSSPYPNSLWGSSRCIALLLVACGPQVEPERQSNRPHAAEFCRYATRMYEDCHGSVFTPEEKQERQEKCEADVAWDWTDHCADRVSAWIECAESVTCEGWKALGNFVEEPGMPRSPCAEEGIARYSMPDCKAYDTSVEIDHGQDMD